jgi:hypothetical protein
MIPAVLAKLAGPIVGPAAVAGCAVLATLLLLSSCENHSLEKAVAKAEKRAAEAQHDLGTCQANRAGLQASLATQNAAVEEWRKAGAEVAAELKKAGQEARASVLGASNRAATIMAQKPTGGDACVRAMEADRLIERYAR